MQIVSFIQEMTVSSLEKLKWLHYQPASPQRNHSCAQYVCDLCGSVSAANECLELLARPAPDAGSIVFHMLVAHHQ
eukprot:2420599-Amphidinium_carterae.1